MGENIVNNHESIAFLKPKIYSAKIFESNEWFVRLRRLKLKVLKFFHQKFQIELKIVSFENIFFRFYFFISFLEFYRFLFKSLWNFDEVFVKYGEK